MIQVLALDADIGNNSLVFYSILAIHYFRALANDSEDVGQVFTMGRGLAAHEWPLATTSQSLHGLSSGGRWGLGEHHRIWVTPQPATPILFIHLFSSPFSSVSAYPPLHLPPSPFFSFSLLFNSSVHYLSIHPCIHTSVCPSILPSICPSLLLSFHPSLRLSFHPSFLPSICQSILLSFISPSTHLPILLPIIFACFSSCAPRPPLCQALC